MSAKNVNGVSRFIKTCQAVQHAHQKGIIRRDVSGRQMLMFDNLTNRIVSASFTPDGRSLLGGFMDQRIRRWDTIPPEILATAESCFLAESPIRWNDIKKGARRWYLFQVSNRRMRLKDEARCWEAG